MSNFKIIKPIITEKSLQLAKDRNQYVFEVPRRVGKVEIKRAVEENFGVEVVEINTLYNRGKARRRLPSRRLVKTPSRRKAVVTLAKGNKIDLFEK